ARASSRAVCVSPRSSASIARCRAAGAPGSTSEGGDIGGTVSTAAAAVADMTASRAATLGPANRVSVASDRRAVLSALVSALVLRAQPLELLRIESHPE